MSAKKTPCPAADDDHYHEDDISDDEDSEQSDSSRYDYSVLEESEIRRRLDEDEDSEQSDSPRYDYSVIEESEIRRRLDADIESVAATYSLPKSSAALLLRHFRWIRSKLDDAWLLDEPSVRRAVGLPDSDLSPTATYDSNLVRSYVEESSYIRWCPAPECVYAVSITRGSGGGGFDVTCKCSKKFCWSCSEEAHQPVDCETVKNWIAKNSAESENVDYILAYTKPCPSCKNPIEKNNGTNHMTCLCGHHFCWLCLADYKNHGACNLFVLNSQKPAQISLDRYAHYYGRWQNNHMSMEKAICDLEFSKKNDAQCLQESELGCTDAETAFLLRAWEQIIECRRVLKWTYAYGYYHIPVEEEKKKAFFEYLQGKAQEGLEKLHSCVELELWPFLWNNVRSLNAFNKFKTKVDNLTRVNKVYFEKLVKALQNGLSDVEFHHNDKKEAESSSSLNNDIEDVDLKEGWNCVCCTFFNPPSIGRCGMCGEADSGHWACSRCTFANAKTVIFCHVCTRLRGTTHL